MNDRIDEHKPLWRKCLSGLSGNDMCISKAHLVIWDLALPQKIGMEHLMLRSSKFIVSIIATFLLAGCLDPTNQVLSDGAPTPSISEANAQSAAGGVFFRTQISDVSVSKSVAVERLSRFAETCFDEKVIQRIGGTFRGVSGDRYSFQTSSSVRGDNFNVVFV